MGKNIIAQARGKGGPTYRAPSFRYKGRVKVSDFVETTQGVVQDIIKCSGHSAPLIKVKYSNGSVDLLPAAENVMVGSDIIIGTDKVSSGNVLRLKDVPEGTLIFNIESKPGDGGKFVRSSGTFAKVLIKTKDQVVVILPSKKQKKFNENCRASIGVIAGGGRLEKPILKAGIKFYKMKAKNKLWPSVSAGSMNAVDHPYGNKRSSRKSKAMPVSRNAPPGRKVGMVAARRTGRKKK